MARASGGPLDGAGAALGPPFVAGPPSERDRQSGTALLACSTYATAPVGMRSLRLTIEPAIAFGLLTRWFHPWALLAGWAAGITGGLLMLYDTPNPLTGKTHFGGAQYALSNFGLDTKVTVYTGILALALNIAVALVASLLLRRAPRGGRDARGGLSGGGRRSGPPVAARAGARRRAAVGPRGQ